MKSKLIFLLTVAGLSIAAARSYDVTFPEAVTVNGTQLPAGEYSLKVNGTTASLVGNGVKAMVQADVTVENSDRKFDNTSAQFSSATGQDKLNEIDLGGTHTRVEFNK